MKTHPAAELFPLMEGDEFNRLVESMLNFGFDAKYPILVDTDRRIIDGRNRARAAQEAEVDPVYVTYSGDDPFGEAVRANVDRRHLTATQIAAALVKSDELKAAEEAAKERQRAHAGTAPGRSAQTLIADRQEVSGTAVADAAKKYGVSPRTVGRVQRAAKEDPAVLDKMLKGEVSATAADEKVRHLRVVEPREAPNRPADVPMPAGMKRSPKQPIADVCKRVGDVALQRRRHRNATRLGVAGRLRQGDGPVGPAHDPNGSHPNHQSTRRSSQCVSQPARQPGSSVLVI